MSSGVESPPEGVDPGQWALDRYREWRKAVFDDGRTPPVPPMEELMAKMREEPPGRGG